MPIGSRAFKIFSNVAEKIAGFDTEQGVDSLRASSD